MLALEIMLSASHQRKCVRMTNRWRERLVRGIVGGIVRGIVRAYSRILQNVWSEEASAKRGIGGCAKNLQVEG